MGGLESPTLRDPVTGMTYKSVFWEPLLQGFGTNVPRPEDVEAELELTAAAAAEKVPFGVPDIPKDAQGRLVPLFTRVRVQMIHHPTGTWKAYFRPVPTVGQPGGWLVYAEGSWRFYVDTPDETN